MPRMADGRDMPHATFVRPDLGSFCRLDELGLQVVGQRLELGRAVLACRIVETDEFARWCRRCGGEAAPRDSVTRRLAHEPLRWPLEGIVCQHLTVARVSEGLGVSWNTANDAVLAEGRCVLIKDPHRFDGVRVIGVDEHCWRHTRRGDKYVTVIIEPNGCEATAVTAGSKSSATRWSPQPTTRTPPGGTSRRVPCSRHWSIACAFRNSPSGSAGIGLSGCWRWNLRRLRKRHV